MIRKAYRYKFADHVDLKDARETLLLAMIAAEGLVGEGRVMLDAAWAADPGINVIVVGASTTVGRIVNAIFTALLSREFGREAFDVRGVECLPLWGATR